MTTTNDDPRRRLRQPSNVLTAAARDWLKGLPAEVRPVELPVAYARIANALQLAWISPQDCLAYLNELVIDQRGGREGFPFGVLVELATLKDFVESNLRVPNPNWTAWDSVAMKRGNRL